MNRQTTSFSLWDVQDELIKYAASRTHHGNASRYFREVVIPLIAAECGRTVPKVPAETVSPPAPSQSGTHSIDLGALAKMVAAEMRKTG